MTDRQSTTRSTTRRMTKAELESLDEKVLDFIRSYQLREGVSPSRQEIATHLKLSGVMAAQRAIERLRQKERLTALKNSKRSICALDSSDDVKPKDSLIQLPLLGAVAAGSPIEAIEQAERIQVPRYLIRGSAPHFVLKVRGDSMIEDHICDGDWVVVRQQSIADSGEKVVAIINGEATLKRFYRKDGRIELHPANPRHHPMLIGPHHHFRIAGVYVGLIRCV